MAGKLRRSPGVLWVVSAAETSWVSRGWREEASGGVWAAGLAGNGAGRELQRERSNRRREKVSGEERERPRDACRQPAGARVLCFSQREITKMPLEFSDL